MGILNFEQTINIFESYNIYKLINSIINKFQIDHEWKKQSNVKDGGITEFVKLYDYGKYAKLFEVNGYIFHEAYIFDHEQYLL